MHLADLHPGGDLGLRQIIEEPQRDDRALACGQASMARSQRLTAKDAVEARLLDAQLATRRARALTVIETGPSLSGSTV